MKKLYFVAMILVSFTLVACAPVTVQKCYKDYKYDENGKLKQEYNECITQVPEKMPPLQLKHKDLYE